MKNSAAIAVYRFAGRPRKFEHNVFPEIVAQPVRKRLHTFGRPADALSNEGTRHVERGSKVAHQCTEECLPTHPGSAFHDMPQYALDMLHPRDVGIERDDTRRLSARMTDHRAQ